VVEVGMVVEMVTEAAAATLLRLSISPLPLLSLSPK
jgi:hypothetical protein